MVDTSDTLNRQLTLDEATRTDFLQASENAYSALAERGYRADEVHKLGVCHQATALIVDSLLDNGYPVDHEVRSGWTVSEHSYVAVDTGLEEDLIIDPTWQQFLPKGTDTSRMPKVLIGTRASVIEQALNFGVDDLTAQLWQSHGIKMTIAHQKSVDLAAEQEADQAEKSGSWDRFISSPR